MINFNLQSISEVNTGLIFQFASLTSNGNVNNQSSVYMTEDAFGLIEGFVYQRVNEYKNYGHWGSTPVNKQEWSLLKDDINHLIVTIRESSELEYLSNILFGFKFIQKDTLNDIKLNYINYKNDILVMLEKLIVWINQQMINHGGIIIIGI